MYDITKDEHINEQSPILLLCNSCLFLTQHNYYSCLHANPMMKIKTSRPILTTNLSRTSEGICTWHISSWRDIADHSTGNTPNAQKQYTSGSA